MNILVTGGAGYIGSHAVLKLKDTDNRIVVYDNLSKGYEKFIFSSDFIKGDIHNKILLEDVIDNFKIDLVMHFAAFIEAGESMQHPGKYFYNNSAGTITLLNTLIEKQVKYFVFSSTAALYGNMVKNEPITEQTPLMPTNPYGESKLIIEKVLKWYSQIHDFNYISLRYFNACGADQQARTGELHHPETHLMPLAIQTALGKRDSLNIYGTDYSTKDGTCIRDYIYVGDIADAHILAMDYLIKEKKSDVFNIGSGQGYSVREVVAAVKKVTGKNFKVIETGHRQGDPEVLIASADKIKQQLGWQPKKPGLEQMVETAVNFYKSRK